jgi:hypothetical protein
MTDTDSIGKSHISNIYYIKEKQSIFPNWSAEGQSKKFRRSFEKHDNANLTADEKYLLFQSIVIESIVLIFLCHRCKNPVDCVEKKIYW